MQFINDNPLEIFEKIDIVNATLDDWDASIIDLNGYDGINIENCEQICMYAIAQFNFIKTNINLSGYYFVDWRVKYVNLEDFILTNKIINISFTAKEFIDKYDEAAILLYERLGVD